MIQSDADGGFSAQAVGHAIFTQGETLDETVANIKEAVDCHFVDQKVAPPIVVNFEVPAFV